MAELICRLAIHYPRTGTSTAEFAALAEDWAEDLAEYPLPVVERAVRLCRTERGRKFFPTTGEMLDFCEQAQGELRRHNARLALPEPDEMGEAELARNRQRCAEILARLRAAGHPGPSPCGGGFPEGVAKGARPQRTC